MARGGPRRTSILYCMLWGMLLLKMRKRQRYSMPSFLLFLIVRLVILWALSSLSFEIEMGRRIIIPYPVSGPSIKSIFLQFGDQDVMQEQCQKLCKSPGRWCQFSSFIHRHCNSIMKGHQVCQAWLALGESMLVTTDHLVFIAKCLGQIVWKAVSRKKIWARYLTVGWTEIVNRDSEVNRSSDCPSVHIADEVAPQVLCLVLDISL